MAALAALSLVTRRSGAGFLFADFPQN